MQINCTTGEQGLEEIPKNEAARLEQERQERVKAAAAAEAAEQAKAAARKSAIAKLSGLGLTQEEISALLSAG
jgi:hypothetical protein